MENKMDHSKQIRHFIGFFLLFGLWSTWENFSHTFLLNLYSFFLTLVLIIVYFEMVFWDYFLVDVTTLAASVTTMLFITTFLAHLVIAFESIARSKTHSQFMEKLSHVDRLISTKQQAFHPYRIKKRADLSLIRTLIAFVVCIKIVFVIFITLQEVTNVYVYCIIYSKWIMHLRAIQVSFLVVLVRNRLTFITEELENLQKEPKTQTECINRKKSPLNQTNFTQIFDLKIIYGELYEIYRLINKSFGWSLLAVITQCFIDIITNCYWGFVGIGLEDRLPNFPFVLVVFTFLAPIFITLSALCFYCSSCYQCVS